MAVNPNDANSIKQNYSGYAGWNDPASIIADFRATGGSGKGGPTSYSSGGGGGGLSAEDTIRRSIEMMKEANQPAVASLQASIPEIGQKYAQTRQQLQSSQPSLEQRYQGLLDQIKGNQTQDVNSQTRITNNELGKRGITGSSTLAQQEIQNAVSPINQNYTNIAKETGLAREDALANLRNQIANLTPQEVSDNRAVQNAIAQMQSGAASSGVTTGMNLYSTNMQQEAAKQAAQYKAEQDAIANQIAQAQLANQTRQTSYDIRKPYYDPKTGSSNSAWE